MVNSKEEKKEETGRKRKDNIIFVIIEVEYEGLKPKLIVQRNHNHTNVRTLEIMGILEIDDILSHDTDQLLCTQQINEKAQT